MKESVNEFVLFVMPVIIVAFLIISLTLICQDHVVTALVQIPAWVGMVLWMWVRYKWFEG